MNYILFCLFCQAVGESIFNREIKIYIYLAGVKFSRHNARLFSFLQEKNFFGWQRTRLSRKIGLSKLISKIILFGKRRFFSINGNSHNKMALIWKDVIL